MESKIEKYISDCTRDCSNELDSYQTNTGAWVDTYHEWLTPDDAREVAEIAKEETIEKAVEWLKYYIYYDDFEWLVPFENDECMIQHFKAYMEE